MSYVQIAWNCIGYAIAFAVCVAVACWLIRVAIDEALTLFRFNRDIIEYFRWKGTFRLWVDNDMPLLKGDGSLCFKTKEAASMKHRTKAKKSNTP